MRDLPVPDWLFFWGGGGRARPLVPRARSTLEDAAARAAARLAIRCRPGSSGSCARRVLHGVLGAISAGLLVLIFLTALIGEPSSAQNLSPTFIYVIFWLGLVPLQVVFGNVWRVLNPWLAIANGVEWIWRKLGQEWKPPLEYPERLGVWPAAFFLLCFAALELCYAEPASPRALALAIALYSYAMWFGMAAYGRREWDSRGNGFSVYFGLLARIAPFGEHEGRLVWRVPFSGLSGRETTPGVLAFVAVMLGSVGFDGFSRSSFWQDLRARDRGAIHRRSAWPGGALLDRALAGRADRLRAPRRARIPRGGAGGRADRPLRPLTRARVRPEPRADRTGLRGRALLHAARDPGAVRAPARLRSLRLRLGPLRHRWTTRRTSLPSPRTPSGTSRSARSSPATSRG